MKRLFLFIIDVLLVSSSPLIAFIVRDNLEFDPQKFELIQTYMFVSIPVAAIVFSLMGVHRGVWRYASLSDLLRVIAATVGSILLALFVTFSINRLEGVPRSIPIIQGLLIVMVLCGLRVVVRLLREWRLRREAAYQQQHQWADPGLQHVLIVGLNRLTELYVEAAAEFDSAVSIAGVLADDADLQGRQVRLCKVVGTTNEVLGVIDRLAVHGVTVERIVVAGPADKLSEETRKQLSAAEGQGILLEFLPELLRFAPGNQDAGAQTQWLPHDIANAGIGISASKRYPMLKRAVDFTAAAMMLVMLAPVFVIVATLVACDVGMPVVFWQQRPGLYGRRFKVYKFRTMRNSHNLAGQRIPDEKRLSAIGRFLRRSRLDELPQLYNVLMGEMSFVGPRPLLAAEQGHLDWSRLVVRPGLTGWAQVNGGRNIAVEEKAALDLWYVKKMSPLLDASILLRTISMLVRGDIPNRKSLKIAMEAMSASTDRSDVGQVSSGRVFENQTGSNR